MHIHSRDQFLKKRWEQLLAILTEKFSETETIDIEGVLYLVGIQELGKLHQRFKKDENVNIIHIGICTVLEPYGYYTFDYYDDDGWPHFRLMEELPPLKAGEQSLLMKEAIVDYFLQKEVIQ
ncbi:MAG: hypothetical protein ACPHSE_05245 [Flavobacteriaceae bacterium]